jgi:hypothetical protein
MKKEYNTPSMTVTSFSNEGVIMASSITAIQTETPQDSSKFTTLSFGKWNS